TSPAESFTPTRPAQPACAGNGNRSTKPQLTKHPNSTPPETKTMKDPLIRYARAGYAGLFLCTPEEIRAEAEVKAAAEELERPLHAWSLTTGFIDTSSGSVRDCPDPVEALSQIDSLEGDCLVL